MTFMRSIEDDSLYQSLQLGLKLFGQEVYFHHQGPEQAHRCTVLHCDGKVELEGMTGQFAPHLFRIVDKSNAER